MTSLRVCSVTHAAVLRDTCPPRAPPQPGFPQRPAALSPNSVNTQLNKFFFNFCLKQGPVIYRLFKLLKVGGRDKKYKNPIS